MKKLPVGDDLKSICEALGADTTGDPITQSIMGHFPAEDHELQRRLIEAKRSRREQWLWLLALISAVASALSAAAAWYSGYATLIMESNFAFEADAVSQRTVPCRVRDPRCSTRR